MILGKYKKERLELLSFVALLGALPVMLILLDIIPYDYRFLVIFSVAILVVVIEKMRHISWRELGFRFDNLIPSLKANFMLMAVLAPILILIKVLNLVDGSTIVDSVGFYVFYFFGLAPIQELIFRSIIFAEFKRSDIKLRWFKITASAFIFVLPHLIYRDFMTIAVALTIGLIWGYLYDRHPNWYGVALSHSVLGSIAIAIGLI